MLWRHRRNSIFSPLMLSGRFHHFIGHANVGLLNYLSSLLWMQSVESCGGIIAGALSARGLALPVSRRPL